MVGGVGKGRHLREALRRALRLRPRPRGRLRHRHRPLPPHLARLLRLLAVPVTAVRGHVIGEHGDAAVICASTTTVHGQPTAVPVQRVRDELAARPRRISDGIGRTRSGPAGAVLTALVHVLGLIDGVTELSVRQEAGVYLGVPVRYTAGTPALCLPSLDSSEAAQLDAATEKLHHTYALLKEEY
ncbi:hypothetical protein R1T08_06895 [Streptomyces sp. SBC-4]|nr:hypothetical protein [Streptomyces sp. SBC-4]MDV5143997.1 hypothetical protein [Streptomyces sp. SBC-4]